MRTSETDPIRVDFLAPADLGLPGRLGLTLAPGKKDPAGGWDRDLDSDLERLRSYYKVDRLVSLMEPYEYRLLKIADLRVRASHHGIVVRRFPIPDVDAPPPASMIRFLALVKAILNDADAGKTVVIHCRGGIGRSGLVAASCLVALGHPPTEAIDRVRSARPRAVEMPVQERWVEAVAERLKSKPRFWWRRRTRRVTMSLAEVRGTIEPVSISTMRCAPTIFHGATMAASRP